MKKESKVVNIIGTVTFITLFAKVLGFVREALQAREFGICDVTDLYTSAYNATTYIFTTIAYALCIAAVPVISKKLSKSKEAAFRATNNILCICLSLSAVFMIFGMVFTKIYLAGSLSSLSPELAKQLVLFTRILFPGILVIVATYLLLSLLQSLEHYVLQGSLSLPYNISIILYLVIFGDKFGMTGLVIVVSAAWILQLCMTFPALVKEKYKFSFVIDLKADYIPDFVKTALVTIFNTSVFLICYLADTNISQKIGDGFVTAFYYADKLFSPLTSTLIYSISTVMFPKFNMEFNKTSVDAYKLYVKNIVEKTVMILLPMSVILAFLSEPIINVVFGGGNFDENSVKMTASILLAYAFGMTGFGVLDLLNKAFYTMGKAVAPLLVNICIVVLNIIFNIAFAGFGSGLLIALMTSISLSIGAILMSILFFINVKSADSIIKIVKSVIASLIIGVILFFMKTGMINISDGNIMQIAKSCVIGALGVIVYLVILRILGEREIFDFILSAFKRKKS